MTRTRGSRLRAWWPGSLARRWDPGRLHPAVLPVVVLGLVAFAVRAIGVQTGFELWLDEMIYGDLGRAVARGELPNLPDGPFFLHPPGMFLVEGAVIALFGLRGYDPASLVFDLRWLVVGIGVLTVVLVFFLVEKVAGRGIAWFVGAVLVFEPFVLRYSSRVFLEPLGTAAAIAGLLVLVRHMTADPDRRTRSAPLLGAGLLSGYAVLTKDMFAIFVLLPVVVAVVWRRTLPGREALVVFAATATPYAIYVLFLAATGNLGGWVAQKADGLVRMSGGKVDTGFNAPGAPSLISRLIVQVGQYGTSYLLLVACPIAGIIACRSARPERRLMGLVALAMSLYGLYSAGFGILEEQFYYSIMLGGVPAIAVAVAEVRERRPSWRRAVLGVASVFLAVTAVLGMRAELTTDNGFRQVQWWVEANLPPDARVGLINPTADWMFGGDDRFGIWVTPRQLRDNNAQYVLTDTLPTSQGYGFGTPRLLDWLAANATPVLRVDGPTNGSTVLWQLDRAALDRGAAEPGWVETQETGPVRR